jgi:hypothetical protein
MQIDWDASRDEGRVCVRVGVDAELDELTEKFAGGCGFVG